MILPVAGVQYGINTNNTISCRIGGLIEIEEKKREEDIKKRNRREEERKEVEGQRRRQSECLAAPWGAVYVHEYVQSGLCSEIRWKQ